MAAPKLCYFDGRGRGAIVRLTLAACGIKITDELLTEKVQIEKWRSVPVLEIDGLKLVQSGAIVRYIAGKEGLLGSSHEETARYVSKGFHKKVTSLPNMAAFLAGPQRRKPNDDVYVFTVKKVLF